MPVTLDRPRRWWPVGHGEQARYTVRVVAAAGTPDEMGYATRTGLRTVKLRRENDAKGGQGFAFVINGVPIFAKGANVIPFDMFPARVDPARIRRELTAARDANMNMLRNWGGGYYEDHAFYDIADELGLLVWQDFMFGGGMQPGTIRRSAPTWWPKRATTCAGCARTPAWCCGVATTKKKPRGRTGDTAAT